MADLDFLGEFGISQNDIAQPQNVYEAFILELSNKLTDNFRDYIFNNVNNTGGLAAATIAYTTGPLTITVESDEYYKFQDQGVNPVGQQKFQTPYSFNFPAVTKNHALAIKQWKGYDLSHAYASASATKNKYGIKPRNITENVMSDEVLERISNDLATLTGLMFQVSFTKNTRTWQ
jgi:hypothetical protein